MTRSAIVAGTFYEADPAACRQSVEKMLTEVQLPDNAPAHPIGGLVPHAGWVCSGAIAAMTFKALTRQWTGGTFVLLGAVHSYTGPEAMVYDTGQWVTPLGEAEIDTDLAGVIRDTCPGVKADCHAHGREHSLEVQIPLIQVLCPEAKIVPILVPPTPQAAAVGKQVAAAVGEITPRPLIVGSTDLTHYGPRYGVTAAGIGPAGVEWAMRNDRQLLAMIEAMYAEQIVAETSRQHSACGGGAIAATIAACAALGAATGTVLRHTNSCETLRAYYPDDTSNSVGYASVVFA